MGFLCFLGFLGLQHAAYSIFFAFFAYFSRTKAEQRRHAESRISLIRPTFPLSDVPDCDVPDRSHAAQ